MCANFPEEGELRIIAQSVDQSFHLHDMDHTHEI